MYWNPTTVLLLQLLEGRLEMVVHLLGDEMIAAALQIFLKKFVAAPWFFWIKPEFWDHSKTKHTALIDTPIQLPHSREHVYMRIHMQLYVSTPDTHNNKMHTTLRHLDCGLVYISWHHRGHQNSIRNNAQSNLKVVWIRTTSNLRCHRDIQIIQTR